MNEVSTQAVSLLVDALEQRGIETETLWRGLDVDRSRLSRRGRIGWGTWTAMLERVEQGVPVPLEELFVTGAADRTGHPFPRIAKAMFSQRDLYTLVGRWGMRQSFTCLRAKVETLGKLHLRLTITVDGGYVGSMAMHRFSVGVFREIPRLQGLPAARVRLLEGATPMRASYSIELQPEPSFARRAGRLLRAMSGTMATLDELENQAHEIAQQNTELERQLALVKERDTWLDVALSAGKIGLWRWDPSTRRVKLSAALADWLGVPGQTDIDTTVWGRLVHPDDQAHIAHVMATSLEQRRPFEAEYRIQQNGVISWYHIKGHVATEPDGRVYAYGSTVDVTETKLIESRLRMADRLIAAGTLAAGVAHEINNPLTYVMGSVDLIRRRLGQHPAARDATQELLAQVVDGVERIRSVVADVRAFARHDDNAITTVEVPSVVASAIRIVGADLRNRAEIITELSPDTPSVLANDARLCQVLINLIVNANQAMPPGRDSAQNRIVIRSRRLGNGDAAIEVEDNGAGIEPDIVPRVFDPFFTTKPVGVGTGLGLSVCQGIVTSLGGRIGLDSTVGRGTRFTVFLKAADDATRGASPARVLVIDDEPLIRSVVARTLAAQGFEVDEAVNGRDGLERAIGHGRYDAILCDLMMPDVDGVALHSELIARRPDLAARLVFVSGGTITPRAQALLDQPGVVVLHKPFAFERLLEAITRATQGTSTSLPLT